MQPPARICLSNVVCFGNCEARSKKTNKKAPVWVLKYNSLLKSQNFDKYHHSLKRREFDNTIVPKKSEF